MSSSSARLIGGGARVGGGGGAGGPPSEANGSSPGSSTGGGGEVWAGASRVLPLGLKAGCSEVTTGLGVKLKSSALASGGGGASAIGSGIVPSLLRSALLAVTAG